MTQKNPPRKYRLTAVNEDGSEEVIKEAISLHTMAISDIEPGIFPVVFVSKEDLKDAYLTRGRKLTKVRRITIDQMTNEDMIDLAGDMWAVVMKTVFRDSIIDSMEKQIERYHARVRARAGVPDTS